MSTAARYRRLAADFTATVDAIPADSWEAPTPCADWSVRDLLWHVIDTQRDALGRWVSAYESERTDAPAAWVRVRDAVQEALDDEEIAASTRESYDDEVSLDEVFGTYYCLDLLVHRWDLARAIGARDLQGLPVDEMNEVRDRLAPMGDMVRQADIFGPEVPVAADATPEEAFLAWTGRDPQWAPVA